MFRQLRRYRQKIEEEKCWKILENQPRGVLAMEGMEGYPYAIPMDYVLIDQKLYFHCAKEGHKIESLRKNPKVSFCVMDEGFRKEGEWALNIHSILLFGKIRIIENPDEILPLLKELGYKYYPNRQEARREAEKFAGRAYILELIPDYISGKLVNES